MDLFEIRAGHVFPTPEALALNPYKMIWEEDSSENREIAIKHFSFIFFTCSPKKTNPFWGYKEEERIAKVKERVYGYVDCEIPLIVVQACIQYKEDLRYFSPSFGLLEDAMVTVEALREFLGDPNVLKRTTPTGAMLIKPKELMVALNELKPTVNKLETLRDAVHEELFKATRNRANRQIGRYERVIPRG